MMHPLEFSVTRWKDGSIIVAFNKGNWLEYSATLMRLPLPQFQGLFQLKKKKLQMYDLKIEHLPLFITQKL